MNERYKHRLQNLDLCGQKQRESARARKSEQDKEDGTNVARAKAADLTGDPAIAHFVLGNKIPWWWM
jgi:hypothetical protein